MTTPRTSAAKATAPKAKNRYAGPSQHPLTTKQKGIICKIARRAYNHRPRSCQFEPWRREEQKLAVGIGSLTMCTQNDYNNLVAHFEGLAGEGGRQFNATYRQQDEALRQARHHLDVALEDRALDPSYAEAICRSQYKRGLDEATAEQLFQLKFTVEHRREALVKVPVGATCDEPF